MDIDDFCGKLARLRLTQTQMALAVIWFYDEKTPNAIVSSGQIAKTIFEAGIGNPHSTRLGEQIRRTGKVIRSSNGFRLKVLARSEIRDLLGPILGAVKPAVDQDLGYLPMEVWTNTRGYLENVCKQLNGCFQFGFYDAASVLVRRVLETLIIEAYETLGRQDEIKGGDGNFLMLRDLVNKVDGGPGLAMGREAKKSLSPIKDLGDRSAHNRRWTATKADLEKIQPGVRVCVDELIEIADLRRKP